MIDLLFLGGRAASQEQLGRLTARGRDLHARVVSWRASARGPSWATASQGVVQANQLLRARISMFAQGRDGGEGFWMRFDHGDTSALRALASCIADAQLSVSALRGSPQPLAGGWVGWLRSRREMLGEPVGAACGSDGTGTPGGAGPAVPALAAPRFTAQEMPRRVSSWVASRNRSARSASRAPG